jgi:hypothetical protein
MKILRILMPAVSRALGLTAAKPVVESARVLPVALGVPLLITGLIGYNRVRGRSRHGGGRNAQ